METTGSLGLRSCLSGPSLLWHFHPKAKNKSISNPSALERTYSAQTRKCHAIVLAVGLLLLTITPLWSGNIVYVGAKGVWSIGAATLPGFVLVFAVLHLVWGRRPCSYWRYCSYWGHVGFGATQLTPVDMPLTGRIAWMLMFSCLLQCCSEHPR